MTTDTLAQDSILFSLLNENQTISFKTLKRHFQLTTDTARAALKSFVDRQDKSTLNLFYSVIYVIENNGISQTYVRIVDGANVDKFLCGLNLKTDATVSLHSASLKTLTDMDTSFEVAEKRERDLWTPDIKPTFTNPNISFSSMSLNAAPTSIKSEVASRASKDDNLVELTSSDNSVSDKLKPTNQKVPDQLETIDETHCEPVKPETNSIKRKATNVGFFENFKKKAQVGNSPSNKVFNSTISSLPDAKTKDEQAVQPSTTTAPATAAEKSFDFTKKNDKDKKLVDELLDFSETAMEPSNVFENKDIDEKMSLDNESTNSKDIEIAAKDTEATTEIVHTNTNDVSNFPKQSTKKRKQITRTERTKDENGYVVFKDITEWVSESEPDEATNDQSNPNKIASPKRPKLNEKPMKKPITSSKQATLTSFFKKN